MQPVLTVFFADYLLRRVYSGFGLVTSRSFDAFNTKAQNTFHFKQMKQ